MLQQLCKRIPTLSKTQVAMQGEGPKSVHDASQLWLDFSLVLHHHMGLNSPEQFTNMGWTVHSSPEMSVLILGAEDGSTLDALNTTKTSGHPAAFGNTCRHKMGTGE